MSYEVNEFDIGESDEDTVDEVHQWDDCMVEPQGSESQPGIEFISDDDFTLSDTDTGEQISSLAACHMLEYC